MGHVHYSMNYQLKCKTWIISFSTREWEFCLIARVRSWLLGRQFYYRINFVSKPCRPTCFVKRCVEHSKLKRNFESFKRPPPFFQVFIAINCQYTSSQKSSTFNNCFQFFCSMIHCLNIRLLMFSLNELIRIPDLTFFDSSCHFWIKIELTFSKVIRKISLFYFQRECSYVFQW